VLRSAQDPDAPVTVLDQRKDVHLRAIVLWIADIEKMQVESVAANVAAIGGHLRLVADFGQATTTFIDHTDTLTA